MTQVDPPSAHVQDVHGPLFWTGVGAGAALLCVGGAYAIVALKERRERHLREGTEFLAFQQPSRVRKSKQRVRSPDRSAGAGVRVELTANSLAG